MTDDISLSKKQINDDYKDNEKIGLKDQIQRSLRQSKLRISNNRQRQLVKIENSLFK